MLPTHTQGPGQHSTFAAPSRARATRIVLGHGGRRIGHVEGEVRDAGVDALEAGRKLRARDLERLGQATQQLQNQRALHVGITNNTARQQVLLALKKKSREHVGTSVDVPSTAMTTLS